MVAISGLNEFKFCEVYPMSGCKQRNQKWIIGFLEATTEVLGDIIGS